MSVQEGEEEKCLGLHTTGQGSPVLQQTLQTQGTAVMARKGHNRAPGLPDLQGVESL